MKKMESFTSEERYKPPVYYPGGYYSGLEIKPEFRDKVKVNGKLLLIHESISTGSTILSIWRNWNDVKCKVCKAPYKVAVYLVPLDYFDSEWHYVGEIFAGGYPQCHCDKKKTHYREINRMPDHFQAAEEITIKDGESNE